VKFLEVIDEILWRPALNFINDPELTELGYSGDKMSWKGSATHLWRIMLDAHPSLAHSAASGAQATRTYLSRLQKSCSDRVKFHRYNLSREYTISRL
jgi:hypothetical protein